MRLMLILRPRRRSTRWPPSSRVVRTIRGPYHVKNDAGEWIVSSAAFSVSKDDSACSIDIGHLLESDGLPIDALFPAMTQSVGLAALRVEQLDAEGIKVHHDPVRDDWYHGGMRGAALGKKAVTRALAKTCELVRPIDQAAAAAYSPAKAGVT